MIKDAAMQRKVERALAMNGGLYDYHDVLGLIEDGKMQSFSDGRNWVVTQILVFPRRRVLDLVFVVGDLEGIIALEPRIEEFARAHQVDLLSTFGAREGWDRYKTAGWKRSSAVYLKEVA